MPQLGKLRFEIFKRTTNFGKGWCWQLKARNNKIIAESEEGYVRKFECKKQIKKLIDNIRFSPIRIIVRS